MPQATVMAVPGPRSPRFPSSKFRAPKGGPGLVRRPRLLERLDRGDQARFTLVVGPAGAGKTMLLADWLASRPERKSAWLSCDAADADPVRFVGAIIEATRYGFGRPSIGEDARQLIGLDGEISADAIAALADDLDVPDEVQVLVIDDFHLAGAASADTLRWLVEYHPPSFQLVVASRVDPPLRLPQCGHTRIWSTCGTGPGLFGRGGEEFACRILGVAGRARLGAGSPAQRGMGCRVADGRDLDPRFARSCLRGWPGAAAPLYRRRLLLGGGPVPSAARGRRIHAGHLGPG